MKRVMVAVVSVCALGLGACASGVKPLPAAPSMSERLEQIQISPNRYRLSYLGKPGMTAEQMKDHAMLGAAKLTIDKGNEWFEVANQNGSEHRHSMEIVMGRGEGLAGGTAKTYDAKLLYAQLSGRLS